MRYKFRGKRIDNGDWIYGSLIGNDVIVGEIVEFTEKYFYTEFWWRVSPETVGQFTGLKDKNGKEIYAGDICKDSLGWVFAVEWDNSGARFIGKHSKPRGDTYICYVDRTPPVEVIGNIHSNPELLEVKA